MPEHAEHFIRDYLLICLALLIVFIVAVIIMYFIIAKTAPPKKPKKREIKFDSKRNSKFIDTEELYSTKELDDIE